MCLKNSKTIEAINTVKKKESRTQEVVFCIGPQALYPKARDTNAIGLRFYTFLSPIYAYMHFDWML